jgi:hypothetical protein
MLGEGLSLDVLAREPADRRGFCQGAFRRKLVLRGAGFQFFECQRQLLEQA